MRNYAYFGLVTVVAAALFLLLSCSGSSSAKPATVQVSLSDPATCAAPQGPFSHIYVTVTDILIHQSATAPDNDPGWVDLTPNLKNNPVQSTYWPAPTNAFSLNSAPAEFSPAPVSRFEFFWPAAV